MRRRRPREPQNTVPEELWPDRWPQCPRWDGGTQPCSCWFAEKQQEWIAVEGNEWLGGPAQYFNDFLALTGLHTCRQPWDQSAI